MYLCRRSFVKIFLGGCTWVWMCLFVDILASRCTCVWMYFCVNFNVLLCACTFVYVLLCVLLYAVVLYFYVDVLICLCGRHPISVGGIFVVSHSSESSNFFIRHPCRTKRSGESRGSATLAECTELISRKSDDVLLRGG